METEFNTIKEALKKANLVTQRGKLTNYAKWKLNRIKNRFGDIALFELWARDRWPKNWPHICGMCGLKLSTTKIQCKGPRNMKLFICMKCYEYGVSQKKVKELL